MRMLAPALLLAGCMVGASDTDHDPAPPPLGVRLSTAAKQPRYAQIRDAARARGMANAFLLAGIANDETGLAMCWSEATWACQGPSSPDCGGGPVIAGAADGPCSAQQGGLGMFQFDAGTFSDTIGALRQRRPHGRRPDRARDRLRDVDGQDLRVHDRRGDRRQGARVDQPLRSEQRARSRPVDLDGRALLQRLPARLELLDDRYRTYSDGFHLAIDEPGGLGFWAAPRERPAGARRRSSARSRRSTSRSAAAARCSARRYRGARHARRHRPLQRVRAGLDLLDARARRARGPRPDPRCVG